MSTIHDSQGRGIGDENPLSTKLGGSDVIIPVDIQARYAQTIQTHNAVSVPLSGNSYMSTFIDCNGFDKIAVTLLNGTTGTMSANIAWSNDGVTNHGYEAIIPSGSGTINQGMIEIKARYAKVQVVNGDAGGAHIMSAWAYLKA